MASDSHPGTSPTGLSPFILEKEKAIDAILCATPDHAHAYVCVTAMRQGKHAYCEKPLTHNAWESRLVAKVAR